MLERFLIEVKQVEGRYHGLEETLVGYGVLRLARVPGDVIARGEY